MKKFELYPSTIYYDNVFNSNQNYISHLVDLTLQLSNANLTKNSCSVRNGWQSENNIYDIPDFAKLADYVLKIIKTELLNKDVTPYISSMWLNIHRQNGFNHVHVHSGGWYSGVFYLKCSENSGNITFTDPRPGAEMSFYHQQTRGQLHTIKPKVGDLILFPSWLPHLVEPNCDTETRISVSFNIELNI